MKTLTSLFSILIISIAINASSVKAAGNKDKKARKLFNLELTDMHNKDVEINDYTKAGKLTVITFFAEYCGPCMRELDSINKRFTGWKNYYNTDFISVCVSNDKNLSAINSKVASRKWAFGMVLDGRNEAVNMLKISHIPYTVVVDKDGYIVYQHEGYSDENLDNIEQIMKGGNNGNMAVK